MDKNILLKAIEGHEILFIKYHAGSQPGTLRAISPIRISGDKVFARCLCTRVVKEYVIDKIEPASALQTNEPLYNPSLDEVDNYSNLKQVYDEKVTELNNLGWHINFEENIISLHKRFKNGKLYKGYEVSISYEKYKKEFIWDDEKEEEVFSGNLIEKKRPWSVNGVQFKKLDKAVKAFLEQAKLLAPKTKNESKI